MECVCDMTDSYSRYDSRTSGKTTAGGEERWLIDASVTRGGLKITKMCSEYIHTHIHTRTHTHTHANMS